MPNAPLTTFNAGVLSPKISERYEIEKYRAGCKVMDNFIPVIYGPAERRPGTVFVADITESPE
jgi:hypothetical protein